jgi:hypothetical protein
MSKPAAHQHAQQGTHPAAPPIRIDSTVQMAWGLTLSFSSNPKENTVGASFLKWFDGLRPWHKNDSAAQAYLDDLGAVLTGYLRTSGYERDVFVRELDILRRIGEVRIRSVTDVADISSASAGSFLSKLAAFLGVGSFAGVVGTLTSITTPTPGLPFNITVVLIFGLLGIVAVMLAFWALRTTLVARAEDRTFKKQGEVWRNRMRPQFKVELVHLVERLKVLSHAHYPDYDEKILHLDDDKLGEYLDEILPSEWLYDIRSRKVGLFNPDYYYMMLGDVKAEVQKEKEQLTGVSVREAQKEPSISSEPQE